MKLEEVEPTPLKSLALERVREGRQLPEGRLGSRKVILGLETPEHVYGRQEGAVSIGSSWVCKGCLVLRPLK